MINMEHTWNHKVWFSALAAPRSAWGIVLKLEMAAITLASAAALIVAYSASGCTRPWLPEGAKKIGELAVYLNSSPAPLNKESSVAVEASLTSTRTRGRSVSCLMASPFHLLASESEYQW